MTNAGMTGESDRLSACRRKSRCSAHLGHSLGRARAGLWRGDLTVSRSKPMMRPGWRCGSRRCGPAAAGAGNARFLVELACDTLPCFDAPGIGRSTREEPLAIERVERRLAAVVAADVAGYSRLMGADEEGTLAGLKGCQGEHSSIRP